VGHFGDIFYRSDEPTNSVKALKEAVQHWLCQLWVHDIYELKQRLLHVWSGTVGIIIDIATGE